MSIKEQRPSVEKADPRYGLLSKTTQDHIANDVGKYCYTVDTYLSFGAKAELIGIPDASGAVKDTLIHVNIDEYKEQFGSRWAFEYIEDASHAKILGTDIKADGEDKTEIEKLIQDLTDDNLSKIQNGDHQYWQLVTNAKLLGYEIDVSGREQSVKDALAYFEKKILERYQGWNDFDKTTLPRHLRVFGGHAAGKAQARVLGINAPTSPDMIKMIEKTIKLAEKERAVILIPQLASDLAIIKAKDIKVGGEKGLELIF